MTAKFQDVQPKFFKVRPMPYVIQTNVEKELARLETDGFIIFMLGYPNIKQDGSTYQDLRQLQRNNKHT